MRTYDDTFSGQRIYPGKGKLYVRGDSKIFRFQNGKSESLFLQRKNPRRIAWTVLYRRQHKKGISEPPILPILSKQYRTLRDFDGEGYREYGYFGRARNWEVAKKRSRRTVKAQRAIVGASLEVIKERRSMRPEARSAARLAAIKESKAKKQETQAAKKAEKAKNAANPKARVTSKQGAKGAPVKVAAKSR
ncbi:ribosomal protein L24e domain-containing protein [Neurospora intermedia]|uniref:Ribosomal protein L24e domain-containing protein n=1 Tax=Neurospora intermedia TaxID=5142 RepID=A0ABR3DNV8_NEUIN